MSRRGKRVRIAKYVYRDGHGISAVVIVRGHREELRFKPHSALHEIQREMRTRREALEKELPEEPERGSLADIVKRYLDPLPEQARPERERLLRPWVSAHGDEPFWQLQRSTLQATADGWRSMGVAASTINKRISALRVAWKATAPDSARVHGIERVTRYTEPLPVARDRPMQLVAEVLDRVEDEKDRLKGLPPLPSKSKARLRVLAWTGQPPARVMAIEPQDVRWEATPPLLYVAPRRKGAGTSDAWLPLVPQAVEALRDFFAAKATGAFTLSPLGRTWARAKRKTQAWLREHGRADDARRLEGFRIYDLRHSFLTALGEEAEDIYAVAEYAGHASLQTTRRYMKGAARRRMAASVAGLTKRFAVPKADPKTPRRKRKRRRRR